VAGPWLGQHFSSPEQYTLLFPVLAATARASAWFTRCTTSSAGAGSSYLAFEVNRLAARKSKGVLAPRTSLCADVFWAIAAAQWFFQPNDFELSPLESGDLNFNTDARYWLHTFCSINASLLEKASRARPNPPTPLAEALTPLRES
jgi:hypothetical protein